MDDNETARILRLRLRTEGFADIQFEDRWEGRRNAGALAARARLIYAGKSAGITVRTRVLRLKSEPGGGVMLGAREDMADEVFANYGEGFFAGQP